MNDWQNTLEILVKTALSLGASHADAVWFENIDLSLACRKGTLEGLERSESQALTLRAFVGESQAIVSSTDISEASLKGLATSAVAMAKIAPPDALSKLAASSLYPASIPDLELCDLEEPTSDALFARAQEVEAAALAIPGITNTEGADASYSRNKIGLMIASDGQIRFAEHYETSYSSLSTSVLAGTGTDMQRDYDSCTRRFASDLKAAKLIGEKAAHRALKRMNPKKIQSGTMPVLYDKRVSKQLVSSLASAINGASIVRGSSFLRGDLGKQVFSKHINISDDPRMIRGLASKPFDGEGVGTRKLAIIENGVLQSWIMDTRSAGALGLITTGHATRGMGSPPSPSATNLYMHAGEYSPQQLMKQMGSGLLITETFGTGINTITGDYSQGASGFMVENGEVTSAVAEITIAGNLRDMFARIIAANDLAFDHATNAPSMLIDGMAVAGA